MTSTTNGVIWSAVERFAPQGIQFLTSIVITRLVCPYDYGVIAVTVIFVALGQAFIDSGFSNALIHKLDRNQKDYSTVFFFNIVIAIIFYAILFLLSQAIANFYGFPELTSVIRVISISLIFSSFSVVQRAILTIKLNFKAQAKASFFSAIASGIVGIISAVYGLGVWALVFQSLTNSVVNMLLLWLIAGWRPSMVFSTESFRNMFSFGSSLLVAGIVHTIYTNLYSIIIGKEYKATDLGYFNRSMTFGSFVPFSLSDVMYRVMYPKQCEIQNNVEELTIMFHRYISMAAFIVFPLCIIISFVSVPLVSSILGTVWIPSSILLSIMSVGYMLRPIICINETVLTVVGKTKLFLKLDIIRKFIGLAIIIVSVKFGIIYMAIGLSLNFLIDYLIDTMFAKKIVSTSFFKQLRIMAPTLINSIISGTCALYASSLFQNELIDLILGVCVGICVYFAIAKIIGSKEFTILKDSFWDIAHSLNI